MAELLFGLRRISRGEVISANILFLTTNRLRAVGCSVIYEYGPNQGHLIQRAHWARAQGPLSQGGPQAVDDHVFLQDYVSL
jgi:hypothetical protein